jgi:hypothetical protein
MSITTEQATAWFADRAKNTPMPGAREMFDLAAAALREKAEREDPPIKMVIPEGIDEQALMEMIRNAPVQILPCEPVQEWISVKDRLPEKFVDVLSYCDHNASFQIDCVDEKGKWYSEYKYSGYTVTHWMPLPQPPKGE